jgi:hypothetical protein
MDYQVYEGSGNHETSVQIHRKQRKEDRYNNVLKKTGKAAPEYSHYRIAYRNISRGDYTENPSLDPTIKKFGNTIVSSHFKTREECVKFINNTLKKDRCRVYGIYGIPHENNDHNDATFIASYRWRNEKWNILLRDLYKTPAVEYGLYLKKISDTNCDGKESHNEPHNDLDNELNDKQNIELHKTPHRFVNLNFMETYLQENGRRGSVYYVTKNGNPWREYFWEWQIFREFTTAQDENGIWRRVTEDIKRFVLAHIEIVNNESP